MSQVRMPPYSQPSPPPPPSQQPLPAVPRFKRRTINTPPDEYFAQNPCCEEPTRRVFTENDLSAWLQSEAFVRIVAFIQSLNDSVANVKNTDSVLVSENVTKVLDMLKILHGWIADIPPLPGVQRFGNKAFREWIARLEENGPKLVADLLPPSYREATAELTAYLVGGFGNGTRIDYGSGHELTFVSFLCCLDFLGIFRKADHPAVVTQLMTEYLKVVRQLQRVYMLEPAGSHGVWGLDDHQFLPYLWGSAQLRDHPRLKPKSILQADLVSHFAYEYLYLGCIKYINEVKSGPFYEHSPMLYDISGVPNWAKVNSGMMKMYVAEVLKKLPIVQHQVFGTLLPFVPAHVDSEGQQMEDSAEESRTLLTDTTSSVMPPPSGRPSTLVDRTLKNPLVTRR